MHPCSRRPVLGTSPPSCIMHVATGSLDWSGTDLRPVASPGVSTWSGERNADRKQAQEWKYDPLSCIDSALAPQSHMPHINTFLKMFCQPFFARRTAPPLIRKVTPAPPFTLQTPGKSNTHRGLSHLLPHYRLGWCQGQGSAGHYSTCHCNYNN